MTTIIVKHRPFSVSSLFKHKSFLKRPMGPHLGRKFTIPLSSPIRPHVLNLQMMAQKSKDFSLLRAEILESIKDAAPQDIETLKTSFNLMLRYFSKIGDLRNGKLLLHLVETGKLLVQWSGNPILISAGLLYLVPLETLRAEKADPRVIDYIERKKAVASYLYMPLAGKTPEETAQSYQYLTKMCLMQESDSNLWLMEAATVFERLSSLDKVDKQAKFTASRAYHVIAPMLSLFNLDDLAVKVEDISFFRLDKEAYERTEGYITTLNGRDRFKVMGDLRALTDLISEELCKKGIKHQVQVDVKSVVRTHKKRNSGDKVTDPSRFRYIIDGTAEQCKEAMGIIASSMKILGYREDLNGRKNFIRGLPIGDAFDEGPKENGYQSLHMHFDGPEGEPINVQIRTEEMHRVAEIGSASHGRFKLVGFIDNAPDGAASITDSLRNEGRKYGVFKGAVYRLVPYPPGRSIRIIDLAFAICANFGLRFPDKVWIERIDPKTGSRDKLPLPFSSPLENGDILLMAEYDLLEKPVLTRTRARNVSTLAAAMAYEFAPRGKLDAQAMAERSSIAAKQGEVAITSAKQSWEFSLRSALIEEIQKEGLNISDININTLASLTHAITLMGLESIGELRLAVGLSREKRRTLERVMEIVRQTSSSIAHQVTRNRDKGFSIDLWVLAYSAPGTLRFFLKLLGEMKYDLLSLSCRPVTSDHGIMRMRISSSRKSSQQVEKDILTLLAKAEDLYQNTEYRVSTQSRSTARISLALSNLDIRKIYRLTELLAGQRANISSSSYTVRRGKLLGELTVSFPFEAGDPFFHKLTVGLKSIGLKNAKITRQ